MNRAGYSVMDRRAAGFRVASGTFKGGGRKHGPWLISDSEKYYEPPSARRTIACASS